MERSRIVIAVAIAAAPIAGVIGSGIAGSGCSEDEKPTIGMTNVDPGGTFGAEVQVRIVGRGRVTGSIPTSIDCPGDCYARYTFASQSDKGASDGLTLKAIPTEGVKFAGWTFEAEQLGTKARGPDNCSPVKRATSQPGDNANPELKLTFGEVNGTPPSGQEGACVGDLLKVPVAYKLVARFEDPPPVPEGGPDADGGDGGVGPGTLLFDTPVAGATGGEIFIVGSRLYWKFTTNTGAQGIATGITSSLPGSQPTVVVSPSGTIPKFEGDQYNVSFETSGGVIGVFNASNTTTALTSFGPAPTCDVLETYSTSLLYCLAQGTLYSWSLTGAGPRTTVTGTVPATPTGRNMAVTSSYFWVVNDPGSANTATIQRVLKSSADSDGGMLTWDNTFITGETNPIRLLTTYSSEYLAWIEYNNAADTGEVHASSPSSSFIYTPVIAESGLRFLAADSTSSNYIIAGVRPTGGGNGGKIYRSIVTSSALSPSVTGIPNLSGVTADSTYIYWTQDDGRVYRRTKL